MFLRASFYRIRLARCHLHGTRARALFSHVFRTLQPVASLRPTSTPSWRCLCVSRISRLSFIAFSFLSIDLFRVPRPVPAMVVCAKKPYTDDPRWWWWRYCSTAAGAIVRNPRPHMLKERKQSRARARARFALSSASVFENTRKISAFNAKHNFAGFFSCVPNTVGLLFPAMIMPHIVRDNYFKCICFCGFFQNSNKTKTTIFYSFQIIPQLIINQYPQKLVYKCTI